MGEALPFFVPTRAAGHDIWTNWKAKLIEEHVQRGSSSREARKKAEKGKTLKLDFAQLCDLLWSRYGYIDAAIIAKWKHSKLALVVKTAIREKTKEIYFRKLELLRLVQMATRAKFEDIDKQAADFKWELELISVEEKIDRGETLTGNVKIKEKKG